MSSASTAIDYRKLIREERRRRLLLSRREAQQQHPHQPTQQPDGVHHVDDEREQATAAAAAAAPTTGQESCPSRVPVASAGVASEAAAEGAAASSPSTSPPSAHGANANSTPERRRPAAASEGLGAVDVSTLKTVCENPPLLRYQRRFLSLSYASKLVRWLDGLPDAARYDPHQTSDTSHGNWTNLPHSRRRVAVFDLTTTTSDVGPLQPLLEALRTLFPPHHPPNHVLVNSYGPNHVGILPHTDGPSYYPLTCTVSLGHSAIFRLQAKKKKENEQHGEDDDVRQRATPTQSPLRIRLPGCGSLVAFSDDLYTNYLHSIDPKASGASVEQDEEEAQADGGGDHGDDGSDDDGLDLDLDLDDILRQVPYDDAMPPTTEASSLTSATRRSSFSRRRHHNHHRISITVRHKYPQTDNDVSVGTREGYIV